MQVSFLSIAIVWWPSSLSCFAMSEPKLPIPIIYAVRFVFAKVKEAANAESPDKIKSEA